MKFKAVLNDTKILLCALSVCKSIHRNCIVRLQASRIRFFTNVDPSDGVQVWLSSRTDYIFSEFHCDSSYKEKSITCEILDMAQLHQTIKLADSRGKSQSGQASLRLSKAADTKQPLLKIFIQGTPGMPDLVYDVPVRILSDAEIESIQAPPLDDERLQIAVPNLTELTTFVEKLRNTSCDLVTFSAQESALSLPGYEERVPPLGHKRDRESSRPLATLIVHAENFRGSFSLRYDDVEMVEQPQDSNDSHNSNEEEEEETRRGGSARLRSASISVEIKRFSRFFSMVKEVLPTQVSLYLMDKKSLVLSVRGVGGTTLAAYIPATFIG